MIHSPYRNEPGYLSFMREILETGDLQDDRSGVGTRSVFGAQIKYDLAGWRIPVLTTKKVFTKSIIEELLWFLRGETNIATLGNGIWDQWADENGELGPIYGKQWRSWVTPNIKEYSVSFDNSTLDVYDIEFETVDQIEKVMTSLKENPTSRRHIVSAWNPADVDDMALPPCHTLFQFFCRPVTQGDLALHGYDLSTIDTDDTLPKYVLSCQLYQRSADYFIGVPFNIASYSILTCMIAKVLNYLPGQFVHTMGDAHIYCNHEKQVKEQLDYANTKGIGEFPTVKFLNVPEKLEHFSPEDIVIEGYEPGPLIRAPVAK